MDIKKLIRRAYKDITPYSSARDEFPAEENYIFLDANENTHNTFDCNHSFYPDPYQPELRKKIANFYQQNFENTFVGNGSDDILNSLVRCFCNPGEDNIVSCPPTFVMFDFYARANDVEHKKVCQIDNFQIDLATIKNTISENTKIIFLCSPNNPTGNSIELETVQEICSFAPGLVVCDQAYIEFSDKPSAVSLLEKNNNLIVSQTFSKAFCSAGVRLGYIFADPEVVQILDRSKLPYNINSLSIEHGLKVIEQYEKVRETIKKIKDEREKLASVLGDFDFVTQVFPSDTNFLLVRVNSAGDLHEYLVKNKIVVRNLNGLVNCENCLRITIGTEAENEKVLASLESYSY